MATDSNFRGYWSIREVMEKVERLGSWMEQFKDGCTTITLKRKDHDLLLRWPKAAALFDITAHGGVIMWKGFVLRADSGPSRYDKSTPTNSEII